MSRKGRSCPLLEETLAVWRVLRDGCNGSTGSITFETLLLLLPGFPEREQVTATLKCLSRGRYARFTGSRRWGTWSLGEVVPKGESVEPGAPGGNNLLHRARKPTATVAPQRERLTAAALVRTVPNSVWSLAQMAEGAQL